MSVQLNSRRRWRLSRACARQSNLWRDAARRFRKNKLAVGALVVMVLLILIAIFADLIAPTPYDYSVIGEALQFPSRQHLLGTDAVGRDFLSRLIYGTRVSLIVGFSVQAIALVCGLTFGLLAGTFGGWVDYIVMRWVEVLTAIPIWLFALFLISVWRASDSAPRQRAAQGDRGDRADRLGRYLPADARPAAVVARRRTLCWPPRRSARPSYRSRCATCCRTP